MALLSLVHLMKECSKFENHIVLKRYYVILTITLIS